jgi:outer membrane protein assembly factor BamE (lipoprotein component of BamABCDE complex)
MLHRRHRIADWLVLRGLLLGKSRPEVIALLGEPPLADKFRGEGMVYVLGPERSLISIDYEWLILRFGKNETVESAWVATD